MRAIVERAGVTITTPHLAVPLRFDMYRLVLVEQDSAEEVAQCVAAVLRTERGTREGRPDFGVPDPTFRQVGPDGIVAEDVIDAVLEAEPRASVLADGSPLQVDGAIGGAVLRIVLEEAGDA